MKFEEVIDVYDKWLYIEDRDYIPIIYATILANRFDDIPVWMFIVGLPSSGKSVVIQNFEGCEEVYMLSSLTPKTLISGWKQKKDDPDTSLIPLLDRKTLLIKDFSTIRSLSPIEKPVIFSQLRDAYDGECKRATGIEIKSYKSKFGLIACVTPDYEKQRVMESMLGERFLTFRLQAPDFDKVKEKVIKNIGKKTAMEKELRSIANKFLSSTLVSSLHKIPKSTINEIFELSKSLVVLRSPVSRDTYRGHIDFPAEIAECAIRVSKNLICLYRALIELGSNDENRLRLIKRIVRDCVPYQRIKTINAIKSGKNKYTEIKEYVKVSDRTISEILEELTFLDILNKDDSKYVIKNTYNNVLY